jgi:hypothetical protein
VNAFLPWTCPMNGNAKWVIGVLGSIAGLAENSRQRQKQ